MITITYRQIVKNVLFSLALILFATNSKGIMAQPAALPDAFDASYSVARGSLTIGSLNASLKYNGNNYEYKKQTNATGVAALLTGIKITENTSGQLSGLQIVPKSYYFNQSRRKKSRIDKTEFSGQNAVGSYKGKAYQVTMPNGTQDRASLELALARDVAQNKPQLKYNVIERGKIKQYNFQKMGVEQITTPAGTYSGIKVKVVREGKKHETLFWLSEELDYLPVKIKHTEKGEVITMLVNNYKKL